jgi:hypothetical protein
MPLYCTSSPSHRPALTAAASSPSFHSNAAQNRPRDTHPRFARQQRIRIGAHDAEPSTLPLPLLHLVRTAQPRSIGSVSCPIHPGHRLSAFLGRLQALVSKLVWPKCVTEWRLISLDLDCGTRGSTGRLVDWLDSRGTGPRRTLRWTSTACTSPRLQQWPSACMRPRMLEACRSPDITGRGSPPGHPMEHRSAACSGSTLVIAAPPWRPYRRWLTGRR